MEIRIRIYLPCAGSILNLTNSFFIIIVVVLRWSTSAVSPLVAIEYNNPVYQTKEKSRDVLFVRKGIRMDTTALHNVNNGKKLYDAICYC